MITGIAFRRCPFFDCFSPKVLHWANETHRRHSAGFNYGVPWRAATRNNVFCMGDGVPRPQWVAQSVPMRMEFTAQSGYLLDVLQREHCLYFYCFLETVFLRRRKGIKRARLYGFATFARQKCVIDVAVLLKVV